MMSSNFQKKFTSYDFVKSAKSCGFSFTCYKEKVDWDKLAQVDLDRIVRELDINVLQDHVSTVVRCDLGELRGVDPGLVKLFRLAQLSLEYCIFCQDQLTSSQLQLELAHEQALKELEALKKELKLMKIELKREIKKRKKLDQQKENNAVNSAFQCTMCPKVFLSLSFLESHMRRRHLSENVDLRDGEKKLQLEVEALQGELAREREASSASALVAKATQVAREETLWAQVEKVQAEQRARHQAELSALTETFQTQLKHNLTSQQWISPSVPDSQALEAQHQQQITALKLQLEQKLDEEMQLIRTQAEEEWQRRLESAEARHFAERDKLQAQLEAQRAEEQSRLAALEARQRKELAARTEAAAAATSQSVPKPAMRRRRTELQPRPKAPESPQLSSSKQTSSISHLAIAKKSPSSGRPPTPPPPAPRRRLQLSEPQDVSADRPRASSLAPADPPKSPPVLAAPVRAAKARSAAKAALVPPGLSSVSLRTPVQPISSSSSDSDSSSDKEKEEETTPQTIQDMKEVLRQHPDILQSLRGDVEAHVSVKLAELGVEQDIEGLSQAELTRISTLLTHHRKLAKKKFKDFSHIRHNLEMTIQDKMVEHGVIEEKVLQEPNLKPSKVKQSGHSGFLAKLTNRYHRKSKNRSSEPKVFTSTPLKNTGVGSSDTLQGILKLSRDQLWLGSKGVASEPSSPTKSPESPRALTRAHSMPGPKSVTFTSSDQQGPSASSSSWDQDSEEAVEMSKPQPGSAGLQLASTKDTESGTITSRAKERPKSAFQTSAAVHQQSKDAVKTDTEHKTALNFLASALPTVQPRVSGSGVCMPTASKPTLPATKTEKSSPDANDNSWDLEDL